MERKGLNIELRLVEFAALMIDIAETLPKSVAGNHISGQLIRSGTSPALQYGEAQSAESRNDFVHKMKVSLKELRETFICLRLIQRKSWSDSEVVAQAMDENNQLISIFVKSIATAQQSGKVKVGV